MNTETNYAEHFYAAINNESDILIKNTEGYPFSALARFLLLYHSKKNNDPSFEQLAKQSAIYFNNIPWIQYQLAGIKGSVENNHDIISSQTQQQIETADNQKTDIAEQGIKNETEALGFSEKESQSVTQDKTQETQYAANEQITDIFDQDTKYETETLGVPEEESQSVSEDESHETQYAANEQITDILDQDIKYETETLGFSEQENQTILQEQPQETQYAANEQITDILNQDIKYETETLGVPKEESQSVSEDESHETQYAANEPAYRSDRQTTQIFDEDIKYETETLGVSEEEENKSIPQEETYYAADEQKTDVTDQHSKNEEELIAFEPLHTVDYFASQGIKISEEALENDHLGQQVKSFTAWLKSMKKLHPGQLLEQNEVIEKIIQSSAEASNQNANVLTEAMAEVLIKQGKREKAIEMFEKLSLMNPSKSAYFAAKIESLKTI